MPNKTHCSGNFCLGTLWSSSNVGLFKRLSGMLIEDMGCKKAKSNLNENLTHFEILNLYKIVFYCLLIDKYLVVCLECLSTE